MLLASNASFLAPADLNSTLEADLITLNDGKKPTTNEEFLKIIELAKESIGSIKVSRPAEDFPCPPELNRVYTKWGILLCRTTYWTSNNIFNPAIMFGAAHAKVIYDSLNVPASQRYTGEMAPDLKRKFGERTRKLFIDAHSQNDATIMTLIQWCYERGYTGK